MKKTILFILLALLFTGCWTSAWVERAKTGTVDTGQVWITGTVASEPDHLHTSQGAVSRFEFIIRETTKAKLVDCKIALEPKCASLKMGERWSFKGWPMSESYVVHFAKKR
jgi:hypothetical protein